VASKHIYTNRLNIKLSTLTPIWLPLLLGGNVVGYSFFPLLYLELISIKELHNSVN